MPQTQSPKDRSSSSASMKGKRFVLVASSFNLTITRGLVREATRVLRRHGASPADIQLLWVPGAFELPVVAARVAAAQPHPDAVIALGALIRGETPQYEVIAHAVAQGLEQVAVTASIPVTFGVVVAATLAQAKARSGLPAPRTHGHGAARQVGRTQHNRGAEAALAAIAVLRMFDRLNV